MLAVAGLNGIKEPNEVMPTWTHPKRGKGGITKEGAQSVMLAASVKGAFSQNALAALQMSFADVEALAK